MKTLLLDNFDELATALFVPKMHYHHYRQNHSEILHRPSDPRILDIENYVQFHVLS
ncbi:hypothetical protein D3C72_2417850 [compost metagenome]